MNIIVKPGERIPLDGCIIEGVSSIDTAALTGESLPLEVKQEDHVLAGCIKIKSRKSVCTIRSSTYFRIGGTGKF